MDGARRHRPIACAILSSRATGRVGHVTEHDREFVNGIVLALLLPSPRRHDPHAAGDRVPQIPSDDDRSEAIDHIGLLQVRRSEFVRRHIEAQRDTIPLEYLPAYAPELNPAECIRGHLKHWSSRGFVATRVTSPFLILRLDPLVSIRSSEYSGNFRPAPRSIQRWGIFKWPGPREVGRPPGCRPILRSGTPVGRLCESFGLRVGHCRPREMCAECKAQCDKQNENFAAHLCISVKNQQVMKAAFDSEVCHFDGHKFLFPENHGIPSHVAAISRRIDAHQFVHTDLIRTRRGSTAGDRFQ